MRVTMALVVAALQLSGANAWTNRWDLSKRFNAVGHPEMECDGQTQAASCCLCQSIVHEIETQLDNTEDDYELDVVFRISEEKKKIKYSRSEARILEVLDTVCERVPLELPEPTKKKQKLLAHACNSFVGEYEDELTRTFFNNYAPAKHRMCSNTINVCQAGETREEL
ncbi:hypothetical protein Poli38472_002055 [Pythium oligandrum]|uniref:Saposin B-type domain-containing protein n=1 Tax=Pythium oligandrum TaxID=41045 RepID=A0A8K1CGI6_PYTOL|nr:hypothetical protein Poli38472_002055 [Pythium oligandrum]|eukprot:TMW63114.1 hypothetical protein Poli38472_002055 [Pythium oligandrum]